jgi:hypothetical protein
VEMTFNQALIFMPMLAVVALTVVGFVRLVIVRVRSTRARDVPFSYYKAFQNGAEPEYVAVVARHYLNLFEAPILFYAACVTVFALGGVTLAVYLTAWGYAILRITQSTIHLTYNNVRHRAYAFLLGWIALTALWVQIGLTIFQRVT